MRNKKTFFIFGGLGDLALRKIFPAFCRMAIDGRLEADWRLVSVGRKPFNNQSFRLYLKQALLDQKLNHGDIDAFLGCVEYCPLNFEIKEDFANLRQYVEPDSDVIYYLAIHSQYYVPVCEQLHQHNALENARVVLEKPIGHDYASAAEINHDLKAYLKEQQIFRIDHYLGKEAVQNLFALRFGNTIFEPLWNRSNIAYVEISIAETLGVEKRGAFYDQIGALRDMIQGHLLQLLSIVAMEVPQDMSPHCVRDEKVKVMRALRPFNTKEDFKNVLRAQYESTPYLPAYREEDNVDSNSETETFVALKCHIDNWRWAGVPFFLRTGKRMQQRLGQIVIHFRNVPCPLFPVTGEGHTENRLVIGLNPQDVVSLNMMAKVPGDSQELAPVQLNLEFSEYFGIRTRDAYERLLNDVIKGDLTLFVRDDEVEAAWNWVEKIINGWKSFDAPLLTYPSSGWGPKESHFHQEGYEWKEMLYNKSK